MCVCQLEFGVTCHLTPAYTRSVNCDILPDQGKSLAVDTSIIAYKDAIDRNDGLMLSLMEMKLK